MKAHDSWQPVVEGFPEINAVEIRLRSGEVHMAQWVVAKKMWLVGRSLVAPEDVTHWRPLRARMQ